MVSTKSRITVISLTISMIIFMTENVQAMGMCEKELKNFGYNGQLDHDTHYFEILSTEPIEWIQKYRVFIDYIDDKIFSTNSDLVKIHCENVEILFDKGFTGALTIDIGMKNTSIMKDKENADLVREYIKFLTHGSYATLEDEKAAFQFDLVYEFALENKIKTTKEGEPCKKALKEEGYNGMFVKDILLFIKKHGIHLYGQKSDIDENDTSFVGRYNMFMQYAKKYVLFTDNNIMDVYCDLLAPLKNEGFNGDLDDDLKLAETYKDKQDHNLKEEVRIYKGYLERVNRNAYEEADIPYPDSFLAQLGLHKLGKIMY